MATIAEALSVIVKDNSIKTNFYGGYSEFVKTIPNATYCSDGNIHRIGFMSPDDTQTYIRLLEQNGLIFLKEEQFMDIAVVDMLRGPTMMCSWLGFARQKFFSELTQYDKSEENFSIVWLLPENIGYGIHMNGEFDLAVPNGWTPDTAIYEKNFYSNYDIKEKLIELENEGGLTKYRDTSTGKMVYVGRPKIKNESTLKNSSYKDINFHS